MPRVLIVGSGLTGSLCACLLRRELQSGVHVVVWDKARGAGGRMCTTRSPDSSSHSADLGAQYITVTPAYALSHHSFYSELLSSGILQPLRGLMEGARQNHGDTNYVTPLGMSSVVKYFLSQSVLSVQQKQNLERVVYSSRFAVALFYSPDVAFGFPWAARYVTHNSCIRYITVESRRRNTADSGRGPSLVVHTSVQFGLEHLDRDKEDIQPVILQELYRLLPDLPQPMSIKCHKWRYSQVLTSVPDSPGHMTILEKPLLVCGGDAFSHSNFDGCVESALSMLSVLKDQL
ncbi:renalase isoform X3 [Betta splendens]|uniref:Renalase isoform X3 n=1 Tax=Betta splendens TaxID=158456 RepID=A0A9W2XEX9_BETSP|nr:renalase isoform X3 [Betta splendens]